MKNLKKVLIVLTINSVVLCGSVFASFPVKTAIKNSDAIQQATTLSSENTINKQAISKAEAVKKSTPSSAQNAPTHNDEFWITLALWFFLWPFAAHRWYRGKPVGWNILFILTAGGCGIWALVDLINILTGKF